ncbi:MAG: deoxyribose-phosphate aldolase [Kiloniellales bacterium]|nr:deoxyribose-phosphate aldolase [Kiloniellales bacterium]MDJ0970680.1 deoxyribose-phosphate aldolase [Kiloniellales bacterium]
MSARPQKLARRLLPLLDLTSLNDDRDDDIARLCAKAATPHGKVAAVCSWPDFAAEMAERLAGSGIGIAVVIDFPEGKGTAKSAAAEVRQALADGATEFDLVMPYRSWLAGERNSAKANISAVKAAAGTALVKVILETGAFPGAAEIAEAARDAIVAGADVLKTSTGKIAVGATPEAAEAMLGVIQKAGGGVGFKAAGGIRNLEDAAVYLDIAERHLGAAWITPAHLRIGASKLLDLVLASLEAGA